MSYLIAFTEGNSDYYYLCGFNGAEEYADSNINDAIRFDTLSQAERKADKMRGRYRVTDVRILDEADDGITDINGKILIFEPYIASTKKIEKSMYDIEDRFDELPDNLKDIARSLRSTLQVDDPVIDKRDGDYYFVFSYYDGDPEYYFDELNIQQNSAEEYNYLNLSEVARNPPRWMKSTKKMKKDLRSDGGTDDDYARAFEYLDNKQVNLNGVAVDWYDMDDIVSGIEGFCKDKGRVSVLARRVLDSLNRGEDFSYDDQYTSHFDVTINKSTKKMKKSTEALVFCNDKVYLMRSDGYPDYVLNDLNDALDHYDDRCEALEEQGLERCWDGGKGWIGNVSHYYKIEGNNGYLEEIPKDEARQMTMDKSAKKSYTPDYHDFRTMLTNMKMTKDNRTVF